MLANLARIEHEEPAVLLIDEVEKVFNQGHGSVDGGTTTTMMSQLLWWLAEHNSRILTVMTTNNVKAIPPELYREGRIDEVMYFGGLDESEAFPFVASVLQTFGVKDDAVMDAIVNHEFGKTEPGKKISQAVLTQAVVKALKNGVAKKALAL
jgi:SpoVK/Ycf46/Vps4 family AAA+-type ATPase